MGNGLFSYKIPIFHVLFTRQLLLSMLTLQIETEKQSIFRYDKRY